MTIDNNPGSENPEENKNPFENEKSQEFSKKQRERLETRRKFGEIGTHKTTGEELAHESSKHDILGLREQAKGSQKVTPTSTDGINTNSEGFVANQAINQDNHEYQIKSPSVTSEKENTIIGGTIAVGESCMAVVNACVGLGKGLLAAIPDAMDIKNYDGFENV